MGKGRAWYIVGSYTCDMCDSCCYTASYKWAGCDVLYLALYCISFVMRIFSRCVLSHSRTCRYSEGGSYDKTFNISGVMLLGLGLAAIGVGIIVSVIGVLFSRFLIDITIKFAQKASKRGKK